MAGSLQSRLTILYIIALNLLPIWGVLDWGWTPFFVFYLFWLETLIVALFNAIKIISCRGGEFEEKLHGSSHRYSGLHVNYASHIGKAIGYFLIRLLVFCFYLVFIVVFIGLIASTNNEKMGILYVMLFRNFSFNLALFAFILNQLIQLIFDFYKNGEYKHTHPSDFASIFDGRQLVVHIAVVLGGLLAARKQLFNNTPDNSSISIIMVTIFCIAKSVYEVFKFMTERTTIEKRDIAQSP